MVRLWAMAISLSVIASGPRWLEASGSKWDGLQRFGVGPASGPVRS